MLPVSNVGAYDGFRAAMEKIEAAKATSAANGTNDTDTTGGAGLPSFLIPGTGNQRRV